MTAVVVSAVCGIIVGAVIGAIDAMLLSRFQSAEALWGLVLLALGGAIVAIPAVRFSKSFARAAGVAVLALAVELTTVVLVQGCRGGAGCTQAVVESLLAPLVFIYVFVSLPSSAALWWLWGRHREN